MNKALLIGAAMTIMAVAQPAQAALPVCSSADISPTSPATTFNSLDCSGFVAGQAFANSAQSLGLLQGLLDDLYGVGVKDAASMTYAKASGISGVMSYDLTSGPFNTTLNGMTLIGMHFGGGNGSPGQVGDMRGTDSSALYVFDAGTDLKTIFWKYGASSDLVLFTTSPPAVPEPSSWAMMICGLGAIGFAMRRARRTVSFA